MHPCVDASRKSLDSDVSQGQDTGLFASYLTRLEPYDMNQLSCTAVRGEDPRKMTLLCNQVVIYRWRLSSRPPFWVSGRVLKDQSIVLRTRHGLLAKSGLRNPFKECLPRVNISLLSIADQKLYTNPTSGRSAWSCLYGLAPGRSFQVTAYQFSMSHDSNLGESSCKNVLAFAVDVWQETMNNREVIGHKT